MQAAIWLFCKKRKKRKVSRALPRASEVFRRQTEVTRTIYLDRKFRKGRMPLRACKSNKSNNDK